jgi:hypothetical protein
MTKRSDMDGRKAHTDVSIHEVLQSSRSVSRPEAFPIVDVVGRSGTITARAGVVVKPCPPSIVCRRRNVERSTWIVEFGSMNNGAAVRLNLNMLRRRTFPGRQTRSLNLCDGRDFVDKSIWNRGWWLYV